MSFKSAMNQVDFSLREVFSKMHVATIMPFSTIIGKDTLPKDKLGAAAFLTKAVMANLATSIVQSVGAPLEAAVSEVLFILGKYWYYKFLLNPTNVSFTHRKLQTTEETSDLTIVNTYRNAAMNLSFSGISGCTIPRDFMEIMETEGKLPMDAINYPKLSAAYFKFRQLEKFYKEINSDIVLMYDLDLYVGKFVSFDYKQDANNPWVINYNMNFIIYPGMELHTTSIYDYKSFFGAMNDRYGTSFATDFEGKSKKAPAPTP